MISQNEIQKIVAHIRDVAHPSHIYIFGSYAKGSAREESDLDIAVIKHDVVDAMSEIVSMKRGVISADYSIDILLFTEAEFFADKEHTSVVIDEIKEHGKLVHAA